MPSIPNLIVPDTLSKEAQHALRLAGDHPLANLVVTTGASPEARDMLEMLKPVNVLAKPVANASQVSSGRIHAHLAIAGLWLLHDALDDAHKICQKYEEGEGAQTAAFWHASLHRREGDFSNAKYWYSLAGKHAALNTLASHASQLTREFAANKMIFKITARGFDPSAFVDFCEAAHEDPRSHQHGAAVMLQRLEWQVLMADTIRMAQT